MKKSNKSEKGISLIGILLLGFILILVLSYFKISVRSVIEDPLAQDNISYIGGNTRNLWDDYFKKPAFYLWNDVFIDIFWVSFIDNMERIRDGKPTDYENLAPTLNQ
ncbi:MAG: hypothetical protein UR25_C0002G0091 [Candidatus Nomurabacteria bacterium GW2011_GWE1_32_28]|uniref:Uncharacterized protein n=1 Tax=Candidatus Nomurabacteria bacterium GW2011_GWF1_31_48 TaxID=1618767 RepID=A0A0G0AV51_9BACT|nr:MAG: hypothetical protein UR10_C0002G0091 [Candidatus Nomurabacteria bacterium GW2011_GWF2_30_133]KKP29020.1 MAG: hypothetical protein UR18_C0001G0141 [Candidatus Nomurabacteria bacterium GW2011_GWE2_31_40]KKP30570.1 MAG: hypothetical protein UR19_C0002G0091 [Candidatus Nomurabacteria bacterium GW2011_GWF1_31_48]KKP35055.1 MAG: hypothetical protein UR25_C0002G0091 [Candidatus Nomurabacteria bacterium GW2011_GWE1_32_28]HAS80581.1 hypothetical protein [Candidatus Nomurabacteria bacterium]